MNQTLLRAVQRAKREMQAHDALSPSSRAEYDALESKVRDARSAWVDAHGSLEGFEASEHGADFERLHELHKTLHAAKITVAAKRETHKSLHAAKKTVARPSGVVPIALHLDAETHKAFKAHCKRRKTTMAAMLRAYVLRCLEAP